MPHALLRSAGSIWALLGLLSAPQVSAAEPFAQHNPLLAPYDSVCDQMGTTVFDAANALNHDSPRYFNKPIERQIHQIWFGDKQWLRDDKSTLWQAMAEHYGYGYTLWGEDQLGVLETLMPKANFELLISLIKSRSFTSASDVLRIFLLSFFGGIYADVDIGPPQHQGKLLDLASVVPLQNLVLMSEHHGRNVGNDVALFAANGLMMASSSHPLMLHLLRTMPENVERFSSFDSARSADFQIAYTTGPFFINRSLSGPITLLPITYLKRLGMVE